MKRTINSLKAFYEGKTILVTGASGYLAWNLVESIVDFDSTILRFTRDRGKLDKIQGKAVVRDIEGDYSDREVWEELMGQADIVFHLAAQTSIYQAEKDSTTDYHKNVFPMRLLLETCRSKDKQPIIIFAGTSTQCGLADRIPVNENIQDRPTTFYDLHKLMAEQYLKYYIGQGYVRGVSLRLTNVYGPGPKSSSVDRGILNLMIRKALLGEELTVYGTGEYVRDYVYVKDVVAMFLKAPSKIEDLNGKHVLLGSGVGCTIRDAVNLVAELVEQKRGEKVIVSNTAPPSMLLPIESRNFVADIGLLTNLTGREIKYSLKDGINNTIEYLTTIAEKIQ